MEKIAQAPVLISARRLVRKRWGLFLSAAVGFSSVIVFLLSTGWRMVTSILVGCDLGVSRYLGHCGWMFSVCGMDHIRRQSAQLGEGHYAIPVLTVTAALASLAAILDELRTPGGHTTHDPLLLTFAIVTIVLSWTFIHTIFTVHYAHEYYAHGRDGGLHFPGNEEPTYWDFAYFSFVVGMTSQVSDVGVTSRNIRQVVAAHGLVSFLYNVAFLALTINIAASAS
jgi:uncharacterized membrane protein